MAGRGRPRSQERDPLILGQSASAGFSATGWTKGSDERTAFGPRALAAQPSGPPLSFDAVAHRSNRVLGSCCRSTWAQPRPARRRARRLGRQRHGTARGRSGSLSSGRLGAVGPGVSGSERAASKVTSASGRDTDLDFGALAGCGATGAWRRGARRINCTTVTGSEASEGWSAVRDAYPGGRQQGEDGEQVRRDRRGQAEHPAPESPHPPFLVQEVEIGGRRAQYHSAAELRSHRALNRRASMIAVAPRVWLRAQPK